jgi:hypothetical protein
VEYPSVIGQDLIASHSVLFSLRVTFAAVCQAVFLALLLFLAGISIHAFLKVYKERVGEVPEPYERLTDSLNTDGTVVPPHQLMRRLTHIQPEHMFQENEE